MLRANEEDESLGNLTTIFEELEINMIVVEVPIFFEKRNLTDKK